MPASTKSVTAAVLIVIVVFSAARADAQVGERVRMEGFEIDKTEVTIGQFQDYAKAANIKTEAEKSGGGFEWGGGWERRAGWVVYQPFGKPPASMDEPAVHLTWAEAQGYCKARGGRLPTRAEWQLAAYTEKRVTPEDGFIPGVTYPYAAGTSPTGMNTNERDRWPTHAAAGTTRKGVNGLFDMGGNAWEWLADRRGSEALTAGGSWWYGPSQTRADGMQWKPADFYAVYVGFRCAYDAGR